MFCYQYMMGTKIAIPKISLNTQNFSLCKFAYSRYCDMMAESHVMSQYNAPSKVFQIVHIWTYA